MSRRQALAPAEPASGGASAPAFLLAIAGVLLFYRQLGWLPATGRTGIASAPTGPTGLLTVDGLLNGRFDISLSALRHLVLPAFTLSLAHWATLGRVTRAAMIEVRSKEYILAAQGRGIPRQSIVWLHALRNAMIPALNSTALSTASLVMGVFVVEIVFGFPGISQVIATSWMYIPDAPIAVGFAVYSILLVLPIMFVFDIIQGLVDPRIRQGVTEQ